MSSPSRVEELSCPVTPPPAVNFGSFGANVDVASLQKGKSAASVAHSAAPLHQYEFGNMDSDRVVVQPKVPEVFNGMPAISFLDTEVYKLSESFDLTIIGKFSYGIPKIFEVTEMLKHCKLKGRFNVSFMDQRHVAIKLFLEEDLNTLWLMDNPNVNGTPVRFFKWTPSFSFEAESPVLPVWIALENLPIFLFHKEALFEIGKLLGKPIKVDGYTANRSKLSQANLCIELDVSKNLPTHLWVKVLDKGTAVKVNYSKVPSYCKGCLKLGHLERACLANGNKEKFHGEKQDDHVVNHLRVRNQRQDNVRKEDQWIEGNGKRGWNNQFARGGIQNGRGRGGRGGRGEFVQWQPMRYKSRGRRLERGGGSREAVREVELVDTGNAFAALNDTSGEVDLPPSLIPSDKGTPSMEVRRGGNLGGCLIKGEA